MNPYYEEAGITIYLGDCREVLRLIRVDAIVSDPPYGLNFKECTWDAAIPDWLPLAREKAAAVLFSTAPTTMWDYPRPDWVLAYSRQGATTRTVQGGFCHWTPVLLYGKSRFKVDFFRSNDKAAHLEPYTRAGGHPCPKPEPVLRWMIEGVSERGQIICDPFMGSGTTLRAAKDLGCCAIGIEIEERYCEIAANRLRQEVLAFT